jgi:hypothetical protein
MMPFHPLKTRKPKWQREVPCGKHGDRSSDHLSHHSRISGEHLKGELDLEKDAERGGRGD